MRKAGKWSNYTTPSLVVGTFLSVVTAFTLFLTNTTDFGISLMIGIAGTTLAIGIDLLDRHEFAAVFSTPSWLREGIRDAGSLCHGILETSEAELDDELRRRLELFLGELETLAIGRFERPREDSSYLLTLTQSASRTLIGVTNANNSHGYARLPWWQSQLGKKYLAANGDAVRRGVTVARIFIVADADKIEEEVSQVLDEQHAEGVRVLVIDHEKVPEGMRINCAVWDERCSWEGKMDAHSQMVGNVYSFGRADVRRLTETFRALETHATVYAPPQSDDTSHA